MTARLSLHDTPNDGLDVAKHAGGHPGLGPDGDEDADKNQTHSLAPVDMPMRAVPRLV